MNSRERYHAVTHYQPADRLFRHEMRAFPELGVHGQWPLGGSYLALSGIDTLMQLDPPAGKPAILASTGALYADMVRPAEANASEVTDG